MTVKDIPPTWHLQVAPIVFAGIFYFIIGRTPWAAAVGALLGVVVFLLRYIDAQREVLAAIERRIAELEQNR
jgi:hypothetical protein